MCGVLCRCLIYLMVCGCMMNLMSKVLVFYRRFYREAVGLTSCKSASWSFFCLRRVLCWVN